MSENRFTANDAGLSAALAELGDTIGAVADMLARLGCTGTQTSGGDPIATYVRTVYGGEFTGLVVDIDVDVKTHAEWWVRVIWLDSSVSQVRTPLAVRRVQNLFARNHFPELERTHG